MTDLVVRIDPFVGDWVSLKSLAERKACATAAARKDWRIGRKPAWTRQTWREAAEPDKAREYATAYEREARGINTANRDMTTDRTKLPGRRQRPDPISEPIWTVRYVFKIDGAAPTVQAHSVASGPTQEEAESRFQRQHRHVTVLPVLSIEDRTACRT